MAGSSFSPGSRQPGDGVTMATALLLEETETGEEGTGERVVIETRIRFHADDRPPRAAGGPAPDTVARFEVHRVVGEMFTERSRGGRDGGGRGA